MTYLCLGNSMSILRLTIPHIIQSIVVLVLAYSSSWGQPLYFAGTFDRPSTTAEQWFGTSVAIDGNRILIGNPGERFQLESWGQAHLFDLTTGDLLQTFTAPMPYNQTNFSEELGIAVALDGDRALIGAHGYNANFFGNNGRALLFDTTTGELLQEFRDPEPTNYDRFGSAVAIQGDWVLIGEDGHAIDDARDGLAHIFSASTGQLQTTFEPPNPTNLPLVGGRFGNAVDLDNGIAVITAHYINEAYLYDLNTGELQHTLDTGGDPSLFFGRTADIEGDRVLVTSDLGEARLFDVATGALLNIFVDPTPGVDNMGSLRAALDDELVVVGDPSGDTQGSSSGQVHIFDAESFALLQTLDNPSPGEGDQFGWSVALDDGRVGIGARLDDSMGLDVGQAYLYAVPEPAPFLTFVTICWGIAGIMRRGLNEFA